MEKHLSEQSVPINDNNAYGIKIDKNTRCIHYSSELDIIAIKFKCCNQYFACHSCHHAIAGHSAERWQKEDFHIKAILCGRCELEMTIDQYLSSENKCFNCRSPLNPQCKTHWNLYFELVEHSCSRAAPNTFSRE